MVVLSSVGVAAALHGPSVLSTAVKGSCALPSPEFFCPRMHYGARIYFDFFRPLMAKNIRRDIRLPSERKAFSASVSLFCAKPNTHSALFVSSESVSFFFLSRSRKPSVRPSVHLTERSSPLCPGTRLAKTEWSGGIFGRWATLIGNGLNGTAREREREIQIRRKMAKSGGGGGGRRRVPLTD